jgi:hypothetical protein
MRQSNVVQIECAVINTDIHFAENSAALEPEKQDLLKKLKLKRDIHMYGAHLCWRIEMGARVAALEENGLEWQADYRRLLTASFYTKLIIVIHRALEILHKLKIEVDNHLKKESDAEVLRSNIWDEVNRHIDGFRQSSVSIPEAQALEKIMRQYFLPLDDNIYGLVVPLLATPTDTIIDLTVSRRQKNQRPGGLD